jgi:hypothetical protein
METFNFQPSNLQPIETAMASFKLTYATMFNHRRAAHRFEQALVKVKADLGKEYAMIIDGRIACRRKFEDRSP